MGCNLINNHKIYIDLMKSSDWPEVKMIYKEGLDTKNATFQTEVPTWEEWDASHHICCRIVAKINEEIVGWIALSPVSSRIVYRGVAEVSIYISNRFSSKGIGNLLMQSLINSSIENNFWTLQSSIFPENIPSIKLHKKNGFREVGRRKKIAQLDGVWRDSILFERRS